MKHFSDNVFDSKVGRGIRRFTCGTALVRPTNLGEHPMLAMSSVSVESWNSLQHFMVALRVRADVPEGQDKSLLRVEKSSASRGAWEPDRSKWTEKPADRDE